MSGVCRHLRQHLHSDNLNVYLFVFGAVIIEKFAHKKFCIKTLIGQIKWVNHALDNKSA